MPAFSHLRLRPLGILTPGEAMLAKCSSTRPSRPTASAARPEAPSRLDRHPQATHMAEAKLTAASAAPQGSTSTSSVATSRASVNRLPTANASRIDAAKVEPANDVPPLSLESVSCSARHAEVTIEQPAEDSSEAADSDAPRLCAGEQSAGTNDSYSQGTPR
eukprot:scaffold236066_cov45-Prasinocladus_malaysianus.AAC.1